MPELVEGAPLVVVQCGVEILECRAHSADGVEARIQLNFRPRQQIAGALLQSDGLKGVVEDAGQVRIAREKLADIPDVREERVSDARQRASMGFYDQNQVRGDTADRILDEMA